MIGVSRLLKSCATPPVSWPSVSSFCASCSLASASSWSRGALLDPRLERLVGAAQPLFALLQLLEPGTRLVLAAARPQRRAREADQGGRMERPLEEGDVAERLEQRAALRDCARARRRCASAG